MPLRAPHLGRKRAARQRHQALADYHRLEVYARDDWRCGYCGARSRKLTLDHRVPVSRGGKTIRTNLLAACLDCNHRKDDMTEEEFRAMPRDASWVVDKRFRP